MQHETTAPKSQTPKSKVYRSAQALHAVRQSAHVPNEADAMERRRKVAEMHITGASTRRIAEALGISWHTADNDIRTLFDIPLEERRPLIVAQAERYGTIMMANWKSMRAGDPDAANVILRAMSGYSKLMGLDAPLQIEIGEPADVVAAAIVAHMAARSGAIDVESHELGASGISEILSRNA